MSTATSLPELPDTGRWLLTRAATVVFALLVTGLAAMPAFWLIGQVETLALGYAWIVALAFAFMLAGWIQQSDSTDDDEEEVIQQLEDADTTAEFALLTAVYIFVPVTMVTSQVLVISSLAYAAGMYTPIGAWSLVIAAVGAPVDAWLGRNVNVSAGVLGFYVALGVLVALAVAQGIRTGAIRGRAEQLREFTPG